MTNTLFIAVFLLLLIFPMLLLFLVYCSSQQKTMVQDNINSLFGSSQGNSVDPDLRLSAVFFFVLLFLLIETKNEKRGNVFCPVFKTLVIRILSNNSVSFPFKFNVCLKSQI